MGRNDGRDEATADDVDGGTLAERLRAAQQAVYGPAADAGAVDRLRELTAVAARAEPDDRATTEPVGAVAEAEGEAQAEVQAAVPPEDPSPARPRPRRPAPRLVAVAGAALVVGALVGLLAGPAVRATAPAVANAVTTAPPSAQQLLQQRVIDSRGALTAQDYYRFFPDDLPIEWGGASTATAFTRLLRSGDLSLSPALSSSDLLLYTICPAGDGQYTWLLSTRDGRAVGSGRGDCGGFDGDTVALPSRDANGLDLRVLTEGDVPFSVTVFER